uniref:Secreted protein n=1 Tax=Steinernema glaseri TaxID=37863 RepID=A0A1I8A309_9BILA
MSLDALSGNVLLSPSASPFLSLLSLGLSVLCTGIQQEAATSSPFDRDGPSASPLSRPRFPIDSHYARGESRFIRFEIESSKPFCIYFVCEMDCEVGWERRAFMRIRKRLYGGRLWDGVGRVILGRRSLKVVGAGTAPKIEATAFPEAFFLGGRFCRYEVTCCE